MYVWVVYTALNKPLMVSSTNDYKGRKKREVGISRLKVTKGTACSSTLKRSYTMIKWDSNLQPLVKSRNMYRGHMGASDPRDAGMVQYLQLNKCNNITNKRKDKNHMVISIDAGKAFKVQHPFTINHSEKWE